MAREGDEADVESAGKESGKANGIQSKDAIAREGDEADKESAGKESGKADGIPSAHLVSLAKHVKVLHQHLQLQQPSSHGSM